jgi:L-alanine-DL-glutamate epimerase-like enolase superfamily enzyme
MSISQVFFEYSLGGEMKITGIENATFRYRSTTVRDEEGHTHPGPEHDAQMTVTRIRTDEVAEGYCFGGSNDMLEPARKALLGRNPLDREQIWQRLRHDQRSHRAQLSDRNIGAIDMALWDLAGRLVGLPVNKLLGGAREIIPAYASSMCGDNIPGGLDTPEAYARFALACKERGYPAFKLHTWMPPFGPDVKRDVAACAAVREAVGPGYPLMLDPFHEYNREEARYLGRELEKLDYYWMEEPMPEHNMSSYVWLCNELSDLMIVGPETAEGKFFTRAEWIIHGACDASRYDVWHGGITAMVKAVHMCEALGVRLEVHGAGPSNAGCLQVLGAMGIPGEYYERGLLHPLWNYDAATPWLNEIIDPLDSEGNIHISQKPGLGFDINWDFINGNIVRAWG